MVYGSTYLSELFFFTADPLKNILRPSFRDEPGRKEWKFSQYNTDRQTDRLDTGQVSPEADLDVVVFIDVFSRLLVLSATIEPYGG